ncbi:MAG: FecR domain-containing protein [Verrucomicrobiota bacterium]
MNSKKLYFLTFLLTSIAFLSAQAAELASAKVLGVTGTATKITKYGQSAPIKTGDILKQGDTIQVEELGQVDLVFSNGSELTVEESSSLKLSKVEQESFPGNDTYEQLEADPSVSQTLLELNYGGLSGHVKKLGEGSKFDILTPLGTAAIRGTRFKISLGFDRSSGQLTLQVTNIDGTVLFTSRYSGAISGGSTVKEYNGGSDNKTSGIPQEVTVSVILNTDSQDYETIVNQVLGSLPEGSQIREDLEQAIEDAEDSKDTEDTSDTATDKEENEFDDIVIIISDEGPQEL